MATRQDKTALSRPRLRCEQAMTLTGTVYRQTVASHSTSTFSGGGCSINVVVETGVFEHTVAASPRHVMVANFLQVTVAVGISD